jgi:hypothetical protein
MCPPQTTIVFNVYKNILRIIKALGQGKKDSREESGTRKQKQPAKGIAGCSF